MRRAWRRMECWFEKLTCKCLWGFLISRRRKSEPHYLPVERKSFSHLKTATINYLDMFFWWQLICLVRQCSKGLWRNLFWRTTIIYLKEANRNRGWEIAKTSNHEPIFKLRHFRKIVLLQLNDKHFANVTNVSAWSFTTHIHWACFRLSVLNQTAFLDFFSWLEIIVRR